MQQRPAQLRMVIELTDSPAAHSPPAGMSIRGFQPGEDEAVYEVHQQIFGDELGVPRDGWEDWLGEAFRPDFDPRFWVLALVDGEVVGICLAYPGAGTFGDAWISIVGVRRPWRGQGIAKAMVTAAFAELWRCGQSRVSLAVDAGDLGAIRLYKLLGMRIDTAP